MTRLRIFMIAGEASGDALGAALLSGLRELAPGTQAQGVAGVQMQALGMESLFPMEELSVMGLAEVLPKYRHLKRRIAQTAQAVLDEKPDVLISIDSPDFCLRVAKIVRAEDPSIRTVHYVAPSVWAWRPGRAVKMARMIDQVLALLPFEPPYMEAAGMRCDFVGHPVVGMPQATRAEADALRAALHVGDAPLVLVLPGSRRSEVNRLMPIFGEALAQLATQRPNMQVVLPAAPGVGPILAEAAASWRIPVHIIGADDPEQKRAAFKAADVALAASGTVSLELAAAGTPMVIGYQLSWLTTQIMRRMALIDTATLVNLVSETRVVPEYLGEKCTPTALCDALGRVLDDPSAQQSACELTMERLGRGGESPGLRAARAVLNGLDT